MLVAVLSMTAAPVAADDSYLIIVEGANGHDRGSLEGFPGRCWGKTADKIYLYGGQAQIAWLDKHEIKHRAVIFDEEPSNLYLCRVDTRDLSLGDPNILEIGADYVLSILPIFNARSYRKLTLRKLPLDVRGNLTAEVVEYHPYIDYLIGGVSVDTIIDFLSRLSGEAPVEVNGDIDTIHTRYSGTGDNELAGRFLKEKLENYNYDVEYHSFFGSGLRHIAAYDLNIVWTVGWGSEVFKSTDGGSTWHSISISPYLPLWGVTNVGADSVWLTGQSGTVEFSSDGGDSFTSQSTGTYFFLFSPCFINATKGWVAGDFGTIIHTTNAGQNWFSQSAPTTYRLYDIDFVDGDYGWAVGRYGVIIHTTNGGTNWNHQESNTAERIYSVDFIDRDNGWAVGGAGVVLRTTNGGIYWQAVNLGEDSENYHVDFAGASQGCIVGWDGVIFITTDGGSNWTRVESGTARDFYGVEFVDNTTGYAAGTAVLRKTTDGGNTWIDLTGGIGEAWKNVVATKTGSVNPRQEVIICGHMDNTSQLPITDAPGADDNGSGSTAVMEVARIFSETPFEKTIKFCLWTGEEQGLLGSGAYAEEAFENQDNIVGVFNFDMICWDANNDHHGELHCGTMGASIELGELLEEVVVDYNIDLSTALFTSGSINLSDHASFWDYNYPAVLGIEDLTGDYNPFIHTTDDNIAFVNASYFTEYVKAAVGAAASLAIPDTNQVGIKDTRESPPGTVLSQNDPNPFNSSTRISFGLAEPGYTAISVYNILGQRIRTLVNGYKPAGTYSVIWDGTDKNGRSVSSGIYFYKIETVTLTDTRKMLLMR
jgi:photosystem II stability/assembly factor-like uncharacterized protein